MESLKREKELEHKNKALLAQIKEVEDQQVLHMQKMADLKTELKQKCFE